MADELQVISVSEVKEVSYPKSHEVTVTIRVKDVTASAAAKMVLDAIEQANDPINDMDEELTTLTKEKL